MAEKRKPGRPPKKEPRRGKKQVSENKVEVAANIVFATEEGKQVLRHLKNVCGFDVSSVVLNPDNEVQDRGTLFNEARRTVYLDLRKLIKPDILKDVEYSIGE